MRAKRIIAAASTLAVAATLTTTITAEAAVQRPTAPATTNGDGSNTQLGALLGSLSYRGAEHPYLVGNLADAVKRFGPTSAQAQAARAGLETNVKALAGLLGSTAAQRKTFAADLTARDAAELAYTSAVATGNAAGQATAKATLTRLAAGFATHVHGAIKAISVADFTAALKTLNTGDEAALSAAARNLPAQFADVEKGSVALSVAMRTVGIILAAQRHYTGLHSVDGLPTPQQGAEYRGLLEAAFTQHVYQTGLLGMAILRNGPRSAAAVAARDAENTNTSTDAALLSVLGPNYAHTRQVWNEHITGYGDYLTGLATNSPSEEAAAKPLLSGYESGITAIVKKSVPAFNTAVLRSDFTGHVSGTLLVFDAEKANSAKLYPMALMGAMHFSDLAAGIANKQQHLKG